MEDPESCKLQSRFGWPDYLVCGLMLLVSIAIGVFYAARAWLKGTSTDEVLVGGRKMGTFPMAMSLIASFMSAVTLLGNPAEMYNYGTQFFMIGIAYLIVVPITAYIYLPVYHRLGITSAYEYLAMRFNNTVRQLGCVIFTLHMILYMPIVVYAPALALNQVTGIDTFVAVSIIFVVCIFYTSIGGIKAVIWTDTFQVVMMFLGMVFVMLRGNFSIEGNTAEVWNKAEESGRLEFFNMDPDPRVRHTFWTMVVGGTFLWVSTYAANQAQIQRYLTVPTVRQARWALWINAIGLVLLLFVCCWSGLVMYAKYFDCDPLTAKRIAASDQLLPIFVMDTMGDLPGIPGIFVAGIFSGALSTVSTGLSALAAITLRDFVSGLCGIKLADKTSAHLAKWISVGYGLVTFGLVFIVSQLGGVLQAAMSIHGMVGGPILGLFTLGVFVPWVNSKGALAGTISGLSLVFWMSIGAQVAAASGVTHFATKPISVENCACNVTAPPYKDPSLPEFDLYAVSYMWYTPIGWTTTILVAVIVSLFTKHQNPSELNIDLLSPPAIWLFDKMPQSWQQKLGWTPSVQRQKDFARSVTAETTLSTIVNEADSKNVKTRY